MIDRIIFLISALYFISTKVECMKLCVVKTDV